MYRQDASQILLSQKSNTSNLELSKKQRELCEVVHELVHLGLVQESMMGALLKRRLAEIQGEEEALVESGHRPTPARLIFHKAKTRKGEIDYLNINLKGSMV